MIRCDGCGTDNRADARFCMECAARLFQRCPACGTESVLQAKFCTHCAAPLAPGAAPPDGAAEPAGAGAEVAPRRPVRGERRHLTILMSDLVDSTGIAASLDPEEWRDLAVRCERAATRAVSRHGGHIARYLGDGMLAYFGYPKALEDDAERAVHAGLAIVEAVAALNRELAAERRPQPRVRVGIDAGDVVVGDGVGLETDVFGDSLNIAARIQALAEPNSVILTAAARRLVAGRFHVEDRGAHELKGVPAPIRLYRVLGPSGVRDRLRATSAVHGLTPFLGREDELRILQNRWQRVRAGEGQVVMVSGEAGIGKSRLLQHFRTLIAPHPHAWLECGGAPFVPNAPFEAVGELLENAFSWQPSDPSEARIAALERSLQAAGAAAAEAIPLVAPLVGLPVPDRYPVSFLPPDDQRRRLLAILARWVFAAAARRPLVIVVEDLHWVDPSSVDLQQVLAEQGAGVPLLLLYTARPEFRSPWPLRAHHAHISLNRLTNRTAREMVELIAPAPLTDAVVTAVAERTDGVPLFVEELTRLVVERGQDAVADAIPATLHDSLMARLDRLGPAKDVVQLGAVIGREFPYQLARAIVPLPEAELQAALAKAADADLLHVRGVPPDAVYHFKHALVQDAAYQALLKSRRRELHRTIATVLVDRFAELANSHPERVAHHYTEALDTEPAVAQWQLAAERAAARGALKEAEARYARAIGLLDHATDLAGTEQQQLLLQLAYGQVLMATHGYAAPEVQAAYVRAGELGRRVGDSGQVVLALMGTWVSNLNRCELQAAHAVAEQVLNTVDANDPLRIWGHVASGITHYHQGDLVGAWTDLERAVALYDEATYRASPQDPGVPAFSYAARTACQLGRFDTARARLRSALDLAGQLKRPFEMASACSIAAGVHLLLGESERARELAETVSDVATTHNMSFYAGDGVILRGRALVERGDPALGIRMIRDGLALQVANGQRVGFGFYLAFLAEAQLRAGSFADALASLDEATLVVPEERIDHPRLLCLRAEIQLAQADEALGALAERGLREAIEVAAAIDARMVGLRAATLLGRHLRQSGRAGEAIAVLAPLCDSFTEGGDVALLRDARALLTALRA